MIELQNESPEFDSLFADTIVDTIKGQDKDTG